MSRTLASESRLGRSPLRGSCPLRFRSVTVRAFPADLLELPVGGPDLILVLAEESIARMPVPVGFERVAFRPAVRQMEVHDAPFCRRSPSRATARVSVARLQAMKSGTVRSTFAQQSLDACERVKS